MRTRKKKEFRVEANESNNLSEAKRDTPRDMGKQGTVQVVSQSNDWGAG